MTKTDDGKLSEDARLVLRELESEPDHAMAQVVPHGLPAAERAQRIERASAIARELAGHGVRLVRRGSPDGEVLALSHSTPTNGCDCAPGQRAVGGLDAVALEQALRSRRRMAAPMPTEGKLFITNVSGTAYAFAAVGGNLAPSANGATNAVPAVATTTEGLKKRPHLRLVRDQN